MNSSSLSQMAAATHLSFSPPISVSSLPLRKPNFVTPNLQTSQSRICTRIRCNTNLLGDFGARDPFPAEVESKFGEKVLGNPDTEHKILIPAASALSLANQECTDISPNQTPLSEFEAKQLLFKVRCTNYSSHPLKTLIERTLSFLSLYLCLFSVYSSSCL